MYGSWENVTDAIFYYAEQRPSAPAIIEGPRTLSYGELAILVQRAAAWLRRMGIERGDRVGVCLTNSADQLLLSFALMHIGAALIEISPQAGQADREAMANKFGVGTLFIEPDNPAVKGTNTHWIDVEWRESLAGETAARIETAGPEPYVIGLSSGSTGVPKGLVTTHRQHIHRFRAALEIFGGKGILSAERPARLLLTAEIAFTGYFQFLLFQLFIGGPIVLLPKPYWVADLVRSAGAWDDTVGLFTPLMARGFLAYARQNGLLFPRMRALIVLGQALFAEEKRAVAAKVTPNLYDVYGNAGTGILSTLGPADMMAKAGTVGRPSALIETEIVDRRGNRVPVGTTGHVRCRGGAVSSGFYNETGTENPTEGFHDGWYYAGDLAAIDENGFLILKGRSTDLIVRRGIEIRPLDIEAVLAEHPSVAEAAVVGKPSASVGEEVVALVVARGAAQHEALTRHLASRLPPEKVPDRIVYAGSLPKTATDKLNRAEIKAMAARLGPSAPMRDDRTRST